MLTNGIALFVNLAASVKLVLDAEGQPQIPSNHTQARLSKKFPKFVQSDVMKNNPVELWQFTVTAKFLGLNGGDEDDADSDFDPNNAEEFGIVHAPPEDDE